MLLHNIKHEISFGHVSSLDYSGFKNLVERIFVLICIIRECREKKPLHFILCKYVVQYNCTSHAEHTRDVYGEKCYISMIHQDQYVKD